MLKYLLSSSDVKFRPPYGKTIKQYRRYTSFIGTTNQLQPLVGNLRDPFYFRQPLCLLRCQTGDTRRLGQVDEQLPLRLQAPHGERLFRILALREIIVTFRWEYMPQTVKIDLNFTLLYRDIRIFCIFAIKYRRRAVNGVGFACEAKKT